MLNLLLILAPFTAISEINGFETGIRSADSGDRGWTAPFQGVASRPKSDTPGVEHLAENARTKIGRASVKYFTEKEFIASDL